MSVHILRIFLEGVGAVLIAPFFECDRTRCDRFGGLGGARWSLGVY